MQPPLPAAAARALVLGLALALAPGAAAGDPGEAAPPLVVYFDLGDTLVTGSRRWAPGAEEALEVLAEAGIPLGILSNTGTLTRGELWVRHMPPGFSFRRFDPRLVLLSSEVGLKKPDPAVFALAVARAGVPAGQVAFLDEGDETIRAAREAGLRATRVRITTREGEGVVASDVAAQARQLAAEVRRRARPQYSVAMSTTVRTPAPRR